MAEVLLEKVFIFNRIFFLNVINDLAAIRGSCLAAALGVTRFITMIAMILVTLCYTPLVRLKCSRNPTQHCCG
jgi:hypothetical protein